ncbi:MAG: HigA family addiction module antitoxin [Rhodobacteraceae bacterium]|nr:HigA family addiction module antitoxin [Paracoccaceae bacterium]MCY4140861.1 HigA family addiction module antitoxin [Paracoccaceae bacterium]
MDSNDRVSVHPVAAPHPGEVIAEYLDYYGWSQRDLARRTGLAPKTISVIFNGKASVTASTALSLEHVFRRPAHLWLNLQRQFDEAEARRQSDTQSIAWENWSRTFPLAELKKSGFSLQPAKSDVDMLLNFLGVSSPECWEEVWKNYNVAFRQTRQFSESIAPSSAWVRETELVAADVVTEDFNEELLRSLIGELRRLTRERVEEAVGRVQTLCATAGVAVVWVPELPNSGISGCARWLSNRKALIGLTLRYKTDDQMWFSFFHELGHLLLHKRMRPFVLDNAAHDFFDRIVDPEMEQYEAEANQFAADTLIPPVALSDFVRRQSFSSDDVHDFSREIGISPGIVVGRLQHMGLLAAYQGNALKQKLQWSHHRLAASALSRN